MKVIGKPQQTSVHLFGVIATGVWGQVALLLDWTPFHDIHRLVLLFWPSRQGVLSSQFGFFTPDQGEGRSEATQGRNLEDRRGPLQQGGGVFLGFQPRIIEGRSHCKHVAGRARLPSASCLPFALHFVLFYFGQVTPYKQHREKHTIHKKTFLMRSSVPLKVLLLASLPSSQSDYLVALIIFHHTPLL